jgi:anaerobic magnesium-protoporphyrin IX monomethyl ester cyclase
MGVGSLSAMLKHHGHATQLVYYTGSEKIARVFQTISKWQPDIIGFSSMSSGFPNVRKLSALIKEQYPQSFVICGGVHPTLVPECLEQTSSLDAICRGEGEYPLLYLVEALQEGKDYSTTPSFWVRQNGKIFKNPLFPVVENLDELPLPDREVFDYESVIQNFHGCCGEFLFCRGCPFDCTYCCNPALKVLYPGKYVRYPSVQRAIDELVQVKNTYCLESVILHDDIITLNKKWFFAFFKEYGTQVALPFACQTRPGSCDREMLKVLKEAGCVRLIVGVESGNEYIRKHVLNRQITNDQILEVFQWAHDENIETLTQNMVGLPEETPKRFMDTIRLTAAAKVECPEVVIFHPYPGTGLYKVCQEQGLIATTHPKEDFKERSDSILRLPYFRRKDIGFYYRYFALLVQRERKAQEYLFCIEKLLPPTPIFFRVILWHEAFKTHYHRVSYKLFSKMVQILRVIRIHGLRVVKRCCSERVYAKMKSAYHGVKLRMR